MLKFFVLFLISFSAYGQGDLSGNLRSQYNNTRLNFGNLQVPNNQATKTGAINALIETGNKNILSNSGFEHQSPGTGWTITGTASTSTETAAPLSGLKSYRADMTAQTFNLIQSTTLYAAARSGSQFFIRATIKNTAPNCTLYLVKNSVRQTGSNDRLELATDGTTRTYELAFLADGTSNGVEIDCTSTTGTLIVDDVELSTESSSFIDVAQIGPWIAYTPTFTGFGTVTVSNFRYRVVGSSIEIEGRFTSGVSTTVEARVSLPAGFVSSAAIPTLQLAGHGERNPGAGATLYSPFVPLIEPSVTYLTFGQRLDSQSGLEKRNANNLVASGNIVSFFASIPVQGLSNKVTTYSQQCVRDVDCENVFSAKVSATGVVSGENLDWINGNAVITSTSTYTLTFNTGIFTVAPNCTSVVESSVNFDATMPSTSSTTAVTRIKNSNDGTAQALGYWIICQKQGADFKAKNVITGTFKDVVTSPNAGRVEVFSFDFGTTNKSTVCSANPCSYLDQIGNSVTSVSYSGTGSYTINLAKTYAKVKCAPALPLLVGGQPVVIAASLSSENSSTVAMEIRRGDTGGAINARGTVVCHGQVQ